MALLNAWPTRSGMVVRDVLPIVDDKVKAPVVDNAIDVDDVEEVHKMLLLQLAIPKVIVLLKRERGRKEILPMPQS